MNKIITALGVGVVALALPLVSFAATATNIQFTNGDITTDGQGGNSVDATFHIVIPANQVVEYIQTRVLGSALAPVCTSVGDTLGLEEGTHDVSLPVKFPPNTGTYTVQVQGAGIYGGIRSVDCNDNVVLSPTNFTGALRTVAVGSSTVVSGSGAPSTPPSWMADFMAQLAVLLHPATPVVVTPPAPVVSPVCVQLASFLSPASQGMRSGANVALQGFLLSQHMNIPALAAGASFGFYGPQTQAAVYTFQSANSCH